MFKIVFILFTFITLSFSNLFTITDRKGNVVHATKMEHSENACLSQKSTEYSLQAIYDELHKAEYLARKAAVARQREERITLAQAEAKKIGKTYKISALDKQKLLEDAKYFKGGKYVWGGTTPEGFDCSGYVQYLYKKHNVNLPRTALGQSHKGSNVNPQNLQKGDLLFFLTDKSRGIPVTHVGIYIGNDEFIHAASTKKGIIVSPLNRGYYSKKFLFAKRVLNKNS